MTELNLIVESTDVIKPAAEVIQLTVEQLGDVGGGVAYVFI